MARPPTPTAVHLNRGTFRADRHAGRADIAAAIGVVAKPAWLDKESAWAWDRIVEHLAPGILTVADELALIGCVRWWAEWNKCDRRLRKNEGDRYKNLVEAALCWKQHTTVAQKLGLTPVARAAMRCEPKEEAKPTHGVSFFDGKN